MALTDTFIKTVKFDGSRTGRKYSDGGGLYLHVTSTGKYWRYNYRFLGRQKTHALGVYPAVTLAKARQKHEQARQSVAADIDPAVAKRERRAETVVAHENTFRVVALQWHALRAKTTSTGTTDKRLRHLEIHVFPHLGHLPVADVEPAQVLAMLDAVVMKGVPYTAGRMREICGQIFRYAIQRGLATFDPAASMRGAIERAVVRHRPALTTKREFGEFVQELKNTNRADPLTRLCARMGLLTWTRPKELRQARWEQIDESAAEWKIPATEMKTGKHLQAHTVPLSPQALALLPLLRELSGHTDRLFPSAGNAGGVISENTINNLFRRMGYADKQSHHGLRASARSLLSERGWSREALERQLDHKEANKAVAAYARSQHLDERRKFMVDWGTLIEELERGVDDAALARPLAAVPVDGAVAVG